MLLSELASTRRQFIGQTVTKRSGLSETLYFMAYRRRRGGRRSFSRRGGRGRRRSFRRGRRLKSYTVSRGGIRL